MVKGTMFIKGPSASHNSLNIIVQKMLLKTFSTLTCITTQSWCRSKRAWMPKGMATWPLGVDTLN
jgi:hypothetical protein